MQTPRTRPDQVFAGVFLIGLAVLFLINYWWPGIMFVIGAAMIARTVAEGHEWTSNRNALSVILIGLIFGIWEFINDVLRLDGDIFWPLVLILVGGYLLFGDRLRGRRPPSDTQFHSQGKLKNDDLL